MQVKEATFRLAKTYENTTTEYMTICAHDAGVFLNWPEIMPFECDAAKVQLLCTLDCCGNNTPVVLKEWSKE